MKSSPSRLWPQFLVLGTAAIMMCLGIAAASYSSQDAPESQERQSPSIKVIAVCDSAVTANWDSPSMPADSAEGTYRVNTVKLSNLSTKCQNKKYRLAASYADESTPRVSAGVLSISSDSAVIGFAHPTDRQLQSIVITVDD